jgi:DNA-directed RNA polymerase specialized sigma24 family protein
MSSVFGDAMSEVNQHRFALPPTGTWASGLAAAVDSQSFQSAVMRALQLRPIYREVFILCEIKGYSIPEAAAILCISEAVVTRRLRRARGEMCGGEANSAAS